MLLVNFDSLKRKSVIANKHTDKTIKSVSIRKFYNNLLQTLNNVKKDSEMKQFVTDY